MSAEKSERQIDGHRLTEFIYGTVVALIAVAGVDVAHASWSNAIAIILGGGVAIWLAHGYSGLMSRRITSGHRMTGSDITEAFGSSWPIVSAAILVALPLLGVALSFYAVDAALQYASIVGVVILALVGLFAGIATKETWPHRLLLIAVSSGLGLLVVALEVVIHH